MALHPVGPLPASTYWRRRALLLLGVVVLLLLARSCVGGEDQPSARGNDALTTPTPTASSPAATTAPTRGAGTPRACPDSALEVETSTDEKTYPVGGAPKITLTVGNTSREACTRDLGPGAIELLVFSGEDRIWSSDDCGKGTASSVVTLAPGARKAVVATWTGKRSRPQCAGSRDQATRGTYRVVSRVGTLRTPGTVFHFRD